MTLSSIVLGIMVILLMPVLAYPFYLLDVSVFVCLLTCIVIIQFRLIKGLKPNYVPSGF